MHSESFTKAHGFSRPLRQPTELNPAEPQRVAGGSPTLPLPPPRREHPTPSPW